MSIETSRGVLPPPFGVDVRWHPTFPPEIRPGLEPVLLRLLVLLPTWVHELRVEWNGEAECTAEVACREHYRDVELTIGPEWFDNAPDRRIRVLVHEFAHGLTAPLDTMVRDLVQRVLADKLTGPDADFLWELRRSVNERATSDVERALYVAATLGANALGLHAPDPARMTEPT